MGVTTKDIAQICKVSRTTVNRALSGTGRISEETKELILRTAKELDYHPDILATSLKNGKTQNLGVLVFDIRNQYFAQMVNAIELEAKKKSYFVSINLHEKNKDTEKEILEKLVDYRVEGIIMSPVSKGKNFAKFVNKLGKPVVIIGNNVDESIPFVGIDEATAAIEAVNHIYSKGYRKIVFVCPPLSDAKNENVFTHEQRKKGFEAAVKKHKDIEQDIISGWDYLDKVIALMKNRSNEEGGKTAFFCSGDIYALEIMKALRGMHLKAGEDFGIMGFDNIDVLDYVIPRLTTIDNAVDMVATEAVNVLFDLINGKEVKDKTIVPHLLIEGETL
ncbi:LacI family DNA-binding transcriptional regulator [Butyrivibrio sp. AC2005]|uniref:LacI family DNA-binding transcriptional regulator n=1 Tax=Butyrivibrio sp. AC2005 TaxID=1280672 RepID=UPI0003F5DC00|nr:LacI family DNA-binding transcriptional regulator [Butyrivibrio sp. AC2005]